VRSTKWLLILQWRFPRERESDGLCFHRFLQPKRNLSAYNMFVADHRPEIMAERVSNANNTTTDECSDGSTAIRSEPQTFLRIASEKWKNLDPAVKEMYVQLARKEKERYKVELALWERDNGGPKRRRSSAGRSSTPPISRVDNIIAVDEADRKSPVCLSTPPIQHNAIFIPKSPAIPVENDMESCWAPLSCLPFHASRFDDKTLVTPCLEAMLPYHSRQNHFATMDAVPIHHSLRGLLSRSSMPDHCNSRVIVQSSYNGQYNNDWELEQYKNQMQVAMQKASQRRSSRCEKVLPLSSACSGQSDARNTLATIVSRTEELDNSHLEPLSTKLAHDDFWMVDNDPNFLADNADLLLSIFD
jgi:HMG-box domain